jgi:hypothetical protein
VVTICTTYYTITEIRRLILAVNIDRFLSGRTSLRITYIRFMAGFDLRSVHVRRVVVKVALGQVFVPVLRFSRSVSFHQCSILICIYTLLLAEGQTGEAWEPSRKQCASGSREALDRKLSQFSCATLLVADLPPRGHGLYLALFHVGLIVGGGFAVCSVAIHSQHYSTSATYLSRHQYCYQKDERSKSETLQKSNALSGVGEHCSTLT